MRVSKQITLEGSLIATGFPYRTDAPYLDEYLAMLKAVMLKAAGLRRPGAAALDLAYVAAGRVDGFWELGLKPWDTAAGTLAHHRSRRPYRHHLRRRIQTGRPRDRGHRQSLRSAGGGAFAPRTSELARSLTSGRRAPPRVPGCASGSSSRAIRSTAPRSRARTRRTRREWRVRRRSRRARSTTRRRCPE